MSAEKRNGLTPLLVNLERGVYHTPNFASSRVKAIFEMSTRTAKTTSNLIYDELKSDIIGGKIEAGKQLRQAELAKRFGSSSIPVREALRQLESEGLVLIQPHRGATVSTFSLTEMLELLDIRLALECRALRLAVPNMTDNDIHLAESVQAEGGKIIRSN